MNIWSNTVKYSQIKDSLLSREVRLSQMRYLQSYFRMRVLLMRGDIREVINFISVDEFIVTLYLFPALPGALSLCSGNSSISQSYKLSYIHTQTEKEI